VDYFGLVGNNIEALFFFSGHIWVYQKAKKKQKQNCILFFFLIIEKIPILNSHKKAFD
jgi:hypothetical protein